MSTNTPPEGITAATAATQVQTQATTLLASSDATSTARLQQLTLVHQARLAQFTRSAAVLKTVSGVSDAQVAAANSAVTATQARVGAIAMISRQASTPAPTVTAAGWALQGRVFNAQLQPVTGYSVFLVDAQKSYQGAYGFAYTDSTGYFLINYGGSPAAVTPALYIEVSNAKGQPVYLATAVFAPAAASTTYQNITLPAGEPVLGKLPADIRTVALPVIDKKTS